jgi:UDP-N-acetylmuramyl pentapeptide phosphotransferase/UDP-N-acetylglucosamine-1-phosphate transferase
MIHYSPLVAFLVTLASIAAILSCSIGKKFQDIPNSRSLHTIPTPRIGGVGLMAGVLGSWLLMYSQLSWWLVLPLMGLIAVSLLDDITNMPVKQRLLVQLVAAAVLVAGTGLFEQEGILVALAVFLLTVWLTNLYNFMDGSNGLAGGMALFGFSSYGIAALLANNEEFAMMNFAISAAALAFLYFNFPSAKVFMGDAGSIPLGFLVAAMGLWGWQQECWPMWFPLLVFSPFIVDASVTLIKRALRGVKITEAHREHYYQRAIQMGWGHRKLALVEYVLMAVVGASALLWREQSLPWLLLLVWSVIYVGVMAALDRSWLQFNRRVRK